MWVAAKFDCPKRQAVPRRHRTPISISEFHSTFHGQDSLSFYKLTRDDSWWLLSKHLKREVQDDSQRSHLYLTMRARARQGGSGQKQGSRVKDCAMCENAPVYMLVRFRPTVERATAVINGPRPPPLPKRYICLLSSGNLRSGPKLLVPAE